MANEITPDSTKTPFSNEDIPRVNANMWDDLSPAQLEEERYKLQQRLNMALTLNNNIAMVKALESGIQNVTNLINNKQKG